VNVGASSAKSTLAVIVVAFTILVVIQAAMSA
jgi:hypothetical protein